MWPGFGPLSHRMKQRWYILVLLLAALAVYANTLRNNFTEDDALYILYNPAVRSFSLRGLFLPNQRSSVFRPLTFATFALNWQLGGPHPLGYHVANLLLNAATVLLLFLLLRRLLEGHPHGDLLAAVAALLFAVHPLHTEAVASVVGRAELLAAAFWFSAWLLHLRDRPLLAGLCFVLALLSKESAVAFFPLVLIGDYALRQRKPLWRYGLYAALTALYLTVSWHVHGGRFGPAGVTFLDNPLANLPVALRIPNALRISWKYLALCFYPAKLSCDYSYNAIPLYSTSWHTLVPAVAAALVVALWIWALITRRTIWAIAGAIYFAGSAITANVLVPTGTIMAERLAYFPSAGICLITGLLWMRMANWRRDAAWALLSVVVVALAARTVVRNEDWRNDFTLFSSAARAYPGSAKMHAGLGTQYLLHGQFQAAEQQLRTALRIYPDLPDAYESLGLVKARLGQDQEARRLLQKAFSTTPKESVTYEYNLENLAAEMIKLGDDDAALKLLNEGIAESPHSPRAWSNRAAIRYRRGEVAEARADAQTALRLDPSNVQAANLLVLLNTAVPAAAPK